MFDYLCVIFVSIPYESHTDRRGYPEIRVVELFITEKQSNEVLMMMKKGRRKESPGRRITKRTERFKAFEVFLEKLYFTLRKALLYSRKALLYTKRLFAIESSSQLYLYLGKALLYSR